MKNLLGICLLINFIAFGYSAYQIAGYYSLIITAAFIAITIMGVVSFSKEVERETEARVRRQYESVRRH
ncbi:hypothetical protein [Cohnella sp. JJ-181]|uniref:hypothetical protein n=1 Tax=Cohnella rhizoplanae TaxID=2974897 RepID=UPI0022FF7729|nr:hypothetical protein [Cohnella sp. JJ-181]CAI6072608.1 hypothetical protein COHCIP112018_02353 [Cohnella sp. JJ-181]